MRGLSQGVKRKESFESKPNRFAYSWLGRVSDCAFFCFLFVTLGVVCAVAQIFLLPALLPELYQPNGLARNSDSAGFHAEAVEIAQSIGEQGWGAWRLVPHGRGHVGLSSALYALLAPQPWVLIPVSAMFMASALTMLRRILVIAAVDEVAATVAVCLLLLLPSTIMITTQWHKDSFAVPSVIAITLGLLLFWRGEKLIFGIILIAVGLVGLWLVRSHIIQVVAGAALVGLSVAALVTNWNRSDARRATMRLVAAVLGLLACKFIIPDWTESNQIENIINVNSDWHAQLPGFIDDRLKKISQLRVSSMEHARHGCATIDHDVRFDNAVSLISYLPRAAAIALFSPFPAQWMEADCQSGGRILRLIGGAEMLVAYAMFLAIPWLAWRQRSHPVFWFVVTSYLVALLVHAIVIVNTGTLFRVRYAWFTLFIALGIAGWISWAGTRFGAAQPKGLGSTDASTKQRE